MCECMSMEKVGDGAVVEHSSLPRRAKTIDSRICLPIPYPRIKISQWATYYPSFLQFFGMLNSTTTTGVLSVVFIIRLAFFFKKTEYIYIAGGVYKIYK